MLAGFFMRSAFAHFFKKYSTTIAGYMVNHILLSRVTP